MLNSRVSARLLPWRRYLFAPRSEDLKFSIGNSPPGPSGFGHGILQRCFDFRGRELVAVNLAKTALLRESEGRAEREFPGLSAECFRSQRQGRNPGAPFDRPLLIDRTDFACLLIELDQDLEDPRKAGLGEDL